MPGRIGHWMMFIQLFILIVSSLKSVLFTGSNHQGADISKTDIKKTIENLADEIKYANLDKLKMIFNRLFQEIEIDPKIKKAKYPRSRELKLKGISLSFTGVKMASPRGFEPLSPA